MKKVLITGGSDGLGKMLAKILVSSKKYKVIILSRDEKNTKQVAKQIGCDYVVADVADYSQVKSAISKVMNKHESIDCLVNNAGVWIQGPLELNDPKEIEKVMRINSIGVINVTHAVLPFMKKIKSGRIINVISQAGLYGKSERSVYTASKFAIAGFTKAMDLELSPFGISVVGFYPGAMKTDFFAKVKINKDMSGYMDIKDVANALKFIIEIPEGLTVPEFGLRSLEQ
jgi:short-subunit dehydrogenase